MLSFDLFFTFWLNDHLNQELFSNIIIKRVQHTLVNQQNEFSVKMSRKLFESTSTI